MQYRQLITILSPTKLSPEKLSSLLGVSNLTYRRWLKRSPSDEIPKKYLRTIAGGIYQLLAEGKLSHDAKGVSTFLNDNMPEFLMAAVGQFNIPKALAAIDVTHQDKVTCALMHIGGNAKARERVGSCAASIKKTMKWGEAWKDRIVQLMQVISSKQLSLADKLIAYGALFYLVLPFDLIPDSFPIFGYVDDFGILGFATAHYTKRFPIRSRKTAITQKPSET